MRAHYTIIPAPTTLGLWPSGVQLLASTLLEHGLAERLAARLGAGPRTLPYNRERDPATGFINGPAARQHALELAALVELEWAQGRIPVILGGDCSILLGPLLAVKRRGRHGLLYLDGHADFFRSTESPTGEIADMGLAIAVGLNDPLLAGIDGLGPYIRPEDAVNYGFRDEALSLHQGMQPIRGSGVHCMDLSEIRKRGSAQALEGAMAILADPALEGVFIHFDTDVLSDDVNPAVDYRLPGGLTFEEVSAAIAVVRASGRLMGLTVSIYNPRLDPSGKVALGLTECLIAGLRG